jgi:ferritin
MLNKKIEDICNRQVEIEEEASVKIILDKLRLVGKNNMYEFDRDIVGLRRPAANYGTNP